MQQAAPRPSGREENRVRPLDLQQAGLDPIKDQHSSLEADLREERHSRPLAQGQGQVFHQQANRGPAGGHHLEARRGGGRLAGRQETGHQRYPEG